jgi:hypothetical protein
MHLLIKILTFEVYDTTEDDALSAKLQSAIFQSINLCFWQQELCQCQ